MIIVMSPNSTPENLESVVGEDEIVKVALYIEEYRAADTVSQFRALEPRLKPVVSGPDWIDIANASVSKGAALRSIQERYAISPTECMGFGDYMNVFNALTQMPRGARTYLYGFHSYWYQP